MNYALFDAIVPIQFCMFVKVFTCFNKIYLTNILCVCVFYLSSVKLLLLLLFLVFSFNCCYSINWVGIENWKQQKLKKKQRAYNRILGLSSCSKTIYTIHSIWSGEERNMYAFVIKQRCDKTDILNVTRRLKIKQFSSCFDCCCCCFVDIAAQASAIVRLLCSRCALLDIGVSFSCSFTCTHTYVWPRMCLPIDGSLLVLNCVELNSCGCCCCCCWWW